MVDATVAPYAVVVDDNSVICLHVADILHDVGFSVFTAGDADTGLDLLLKYADRIALLVTNVDIPGRLNGFELSRYAAERWPSTAIVVSSGCVEPGEGDMPPGARFVAKPFSDEQVIAEIGKLLTVKNHDMARV